MKKSHRVLIGVGIGAVAVIAVAGIAAPAVFRALMPSSAVDAPSLKTDQSVLGAATGESLDAGSLAGEWTIVEPSEAGYRVNEVLSGSDVTVTGRTSTVTGSLTLGGTGLTLTRATIEVDVASISTDSANRDAYFRDTAVNVAAHPKATFELTDPVTVSEAPTSGEVITVEAKGDLTLAGITKPVTVSLEVQSDGESTKVAGSVPITFSDFGVDAPSLGFVEVEDAGAVEFSLTAQHQVD